MASNYVETGYVNDNYILDGVYIDWGTKIIHVPRTSLELVQSSPTVIYNMDINWFRMALKDLEDDPEGMGFTKTNLHNTEVTLGGITFARVVEILEPYTVTFEDGQYAVNLVGANSNIGDRVNVNQVSVRSQNSAGLISSADIEYGSFNGYVSVNVDTGVAGTLYPTGTPKQPVNNIEDAKLIADRRGFKKIFLETDLTITEAIDFTGFIFEGNNHVSTVLTIEEDAIVDNCKIIQCTLKDCTLDNDIEIQSCIVENIVYVNGHIHDCGLVGNIVLGGNKDTVFANCYTIDQDNPAVIDMGGTGNSIAMPNYSGVIWFHNLHDPDQEIGLGLNAGYVYLMDTITEGWIIVAGSGLIDDQSTGSAIVNTDGLMNKALVAEGVWDEPIGNHLIAGTTGLSIGRQQFAGVVHVGVGGLAGTEFPIGTEANPVNNMTDALLIAQANGISTFHMLTDFTITGGSYTGFTFEGAGRKSPYLTFDGTQLIGCQFENIEVVGTVTDDSTMGLNFCTIDEFSGGRIHAYECIFEGDIHLGPGESNFYTCTDGVPGIGIPNIHLNGCTSLGIWNWNGGIRLSDIVTVDTEITCMIAQGRLWVDSTCVEGDIIVKGMADLRGTTGGTTIDSEGLITGDTIAQYVWDEPIADHLIADTMGHQMYHQAYDNVVHIDTVNGVAGTEFPTGTTHQPCNNLDDALAIANIHFIPLIHVEGSLEIDGQDITGKTIGADRSTGNAITITSMVNTGVAYFEDVTVSGALAGSTRFTTCVLGALTGFDGGAKNCLITNDITITGSGANYFTDCDAYTTNSTPKNISVGDNYLNIIRGEGIYKISDYTGLATLLVNIDSGHVEIDPTCVSGIIVVTGPANLIDNSDAGCMVVDGTLTQAGITETVWSYERTP